MQLDIQKDSITFIEEGKAEYTSWYINENEQFVVDILKAKKYEYLTSDEHSHKCNYEKHEFNSFLDAYTFVILHYDLRPSELEMEMHDSLDRSFTYSRSVAEFVLRRTQNG